MSLSKFVQEVLGEIMSTKGYTYIKGIPLIWRYEKIKDGIRLKITISKSRFDKEVKLVFYSSAYGHGDVELRDFVPGINQETWSYNTNDEFRTIIKQFKEWLISYGFDYHLPYRRKSQVMLKYL